jgi:hypothetical protein
MSEEPIVKLEPGGKASVLSYNVPEPVSYSGSNIIALDVPESWFRNEPGIGGRFPDAPAPTKSNLERLSKERMSWRTETILAEMFKAMAVTPMPASPTISPDIAALAAKEAGAGRLLVRVPTVMKGVAMVRSMEPPKVLRPRIFLREKYRLSSFLGQYGAGRTVKTFSLLPGEKTKISMTTYLKSTTTAKQASSILDSVTETSATEFQQSVSDEESDKRSTQDSLEWHVEAEAEASWGFGSAKVSGGAKGASAAQREQFGKKMSSATGKHAATASAKRDVQVNTSYEATTESGENTAVERIIENINVSRTLNFVFRQMNQEFITILHLVDVEIGFFNGEAGSGRVVPLFRLRELIDEVVDNAPGEMPDARRDQVETWVRQELDAILDWNGEPANAGATRFIETATPVDGDGEPLAPYLRVNRRFTQTYRNEATGFEASVPGVIISADVNVMRTEGVIVEALLGQANALDPYSDNLQKVAIREKELANARVQAALDVLAGGDAVKGELYATLFPQPLAPPMTFQTMPTQPAATPVKPP